jgi:predicted nucleic acid-binding protein
MLGFLLPKLAWLSLLAVLPVVIHLLNRIRLRRVDFSSLQFLRDVKRERFNWLRLKEILLLIARTAVLFFLFLGLSRPFLRQGLFGIRREVSTVLVIDDSYSMQYGSCAERARQAAKAYLARLTGSSEAAVLTASAAYSESSPLLTRDVKSLIRAIDGVEMSYTGVDLAAAVEQAQALLDRAILPTREIVVFTDLQRRASAPVPKIEGRPYSVLVKDCGNPDWRNCAVTAVAPRERLPEPGQPVTLSATVRNFGSVDETRVVTLTSGALTETRAISIPAGDEKTVDFEQQFIEPGTVSGSVALDADSLLVDDRRFLAFDVPSRLPVLVVGDTPEDTLYLSRALAPETTGVFRVTTRLSSALRTVDLRRFKALALVNPASLTAFDWQRVADFARQGGGVLVALSREPKDKSFLSEYVSFEAEVKPSGFVTIDRLDSRHPVFEAFKDRADLSLTRFTHYARLAPTNATVAASFSDGTPYLLESKSDRVMIAASGLSLADNDLPFRALFVPLMHRVLSYLSQEQLRHDFLVGDTITARVPGIGLVPVRTPDGEYSVTPEQQAEARTIRFATTDEPGVYTIGEQQYAVNVLSQEGDLARMPESELARKNFQLFKDARGRTSDLTNAFLLVAGLCLVLEMLLLVL